MHWRANCLGVFSARYFRPIASSPSGMYLCALLVMFAASSTFYAQANDVRMLKPDELVERAAKANDLHSYGVKLEAGQAVTVKILKHSLGVKILAFSPDGAEYGAVWGTLAESSMFPLVILAETPGVYRIDVTAYGGPSGTYSMFADTPRIASERDIQYSLANRKTLEYRKFYRSGPKSQNEISKKGYEIDNEILKIYRSLEDREAIIHILTSIALGCQILGNLPEALDHYLEALSLARSAGSYGDVRQLFRSLSKVYASLGDSQKSIDYANQALVFVRAKNDRGWEAVFLHDLAIRHHLLADVPRALDYYQQTIAINRSIGVPNPTGALHLAIPLCNIGNLYRGVGPSDVGASEDVLDFLTERTARDRQDALGYYEQALKISERNSYYKSYVFVRMSDTYLELGNFPKALDVLNEAMSLLRDHREPGGYSPTLLVKRRLGHLYALMGDYEKASKYHEDVITLLDSGKDNRAQASIMIAVAKDYHRAGDTQGSLELLNKAFDIANGRGQLGDASAALFEAAQFERDLGNFSNARSRVEEAISIAESLRARITTEDLRTRYFSTVKHYYDFYVGLLMQAHKSQPEKGFDALALHASEKGRSRSLLDLLTASGVNIRQGVDPVLLGREKAVRMDLAEKANQQSRVLLRNHTDVEAATISRQVSELTDSLAQVQTEIRKTSPRYAALTQPTALDAQQIRQMLDSGTILLEYALGDKKSYMWIVTADSITSFDLPARAEIEAKARKVYETITARNTASNGVKPEQSRAKAAVADAEYAIASRDLSQMLLGPAVDHLHDKRLVVVPDGALSYISFTALPLPNESNAPTFLGSAHEIVTLQSASTLARLREETKSRTAADMNVAIFADPVFGWQDSRMGATAKKGASAKPDMTGTVAMRDFERATADVGLTGQESNGLPRLPFSRREADSIFAASPKGMSLKKVDLAASKDEVFKSDLERYRIVHFATHGLLDSQHPELSGVVLSLVDKDSKPVDGFLRLQDIYNLKLNADLVVLSACNTALGKEVRGEGLIGLTRGFMYAGAPRVVASLWKVDDAATAELMSIFYRKMLQDQLRPAAALRAAQLELSKKPRWRSPYYWAPFVLQGEWK